MKNAKAILPWFLVAVLLHLAASWSVFALLVGRGVEIFHGAPKGMADLFLGIGAHALLWPLVFPLVFLLPVDFDSMESFCLFLSNSTIWCFILFWIFGRVRRFYSSAKATQEGALANAEPGE